MLTYQSFATPYVHLGIKRIVVKEVGAMEFLVMGLVHCYHVLLPFENLNLEDFNVTIEDISTFLTSSATSGPLLRKPPSLVTATRVLSSPSIITASSLSVFLNIMYGIQSMLT